MLSFLHRSGVLRILFYLVVASVFFMLVNDQWSRSKIWQQPIELVIYPVNGDGRMDTQYYIEALTIDHLEQIAPFIEQQYQHFQPDSSIALNVTLAKQIKQYPPADWADHGGLQWLWALQLRWWVRSNDPWRAGDADVRIYLQLFSPVTAKKLEHSVGLQRGRIGIVNGFASVDFQALNNVVITHELLHTFGATDKYNDQFNPVFPDGFSNPEQSPLYPQRKAELMGGAIPLREDKFRLPKGLDEVMIGPVTAREIGWL